MIHFDALDFSETVFLKEWRVSFDAQCSLHEARFADVWQFERQKKMMLAKLATEDSRSYQTLKLTRVFCNILYKH